VGGSEVVSKEHLVVARYLKELVGSAHPTWHRRDACATKDKGIFGRVAQEFLGLSNP